MENFLLKESGLEEQPDMARFFIWNLDVTQWTKREHLCDKYSWAVPNEAALKAIAKHAPIVEIGAGRGYWAKLLQDRGVDIIPYDINPPSLGNNSYHRGFHKLTWTEVFSGNAKKAALHNDRTLFLCWPPYDTSCAFDALNNYTGKKVIFVGEEQGGCTGDNKFFSLLSKNFKMTKQISIPQWFGIHDSLMIFKRKRLTIF
jgi:hypothetical protein